MEKRYSERNLLLAFEYFGSSILIPKIAFGTLHHTETFYPWEARERCCYYYGQ